MEQLHGNSSRFVRELKKEVAKISWFHVIDLGNGVKTPGVDNNLAKLSRLGLSENLRGKTVLDVGAWDGFYSFEAERRGAKRVLATDSFCWSGEGRQTKAGFEFARKALNSKLEDMNIDVLDLYPEKVGTFDLVLFLGVLYHMRHPLLSLERVYSVTADQLILETEVDMLWIKKPVMRFYPAKELEGDPTSWWGPNPPAIEAMLKAVGFKRVKKVSHYSLAFRVARALDHKLKRGGSFFQRIYRGRAVFHAWR